MKIHVGATSWFKRYTGGKTELELELPEGTTAMEAVRKTGIIEEEVGFVTVNNTRVDLEYVLNDGDSVRVYSQIIGG